MATKPNIIYDDLMHIHQLQVQLYFVHGINIIFAVCLVFLTPLHVATIIFFNKKKNQAKSVPNLNWKKYKLNRLNNILEMGI